MDPKTLIDIVSGPMKLLLALPLLCLAACNDHQKAPDDVPLGRAAVGQAPKTNAAAPSQAIVTGTIKVSDALKDKIPANATLFIVARPHGAGGPPALVKRVSGVTFPYEFRLASDDVMMPNAPVPEALSVSARVDQDGDAISRSPGDLMGMVKTPVAKGSSGVELVLDEAVASAP